MSKGQDRAAARRRRLSVVAPLVAALAMLALVTAPGVSAKGPPGYYGVTPTIGPTDADLARMGRARVGTLRLMMNWGAVQPTQGGPYDFADTDRIVARSAEQGIALLPFLYGTPAWARNCARVPARYCDRVDPLRSSAGQTGWPAFAAALAARYGPNGTLWSDASDAYNPPYAPITQWQIWNEANSSTFFRPSPTPRAYYRLLSATAGAIRSVDPGARIVLAGLFGTPPKGTSMPRFLNRLYRFKGVKKLFDAVALHPYSPDVTGITLQLEQARKVMRKRKDSKTPLTLTEIGWGSQRKGKRFSSLYKGSKGQRSILKRAFKLLSAKRKRYRLDGLFWFSWRDLPKGQAGACLLCESFGLLRANSSAKRSLGAFTRFTGGS